MAGFAWSVVCAIFAQNVGVGTTSPQARLHVQAPANFAQPLLLVDQAGNNVPYLVVLPNGYVGIGVSLAQARLHVVGTGLFTDTLTVLAPLYLMGEFAPGGNPGTSGFVLMSQGPGQPPVWLDTALLTSSGDNWGNQVAQTASPVTGNGLVGNPITLIPGQNAGDILQWNGNAWQVVALANAETDPNAWRLTGNAIGATDFLGTTNNQPLVFKTNNTERMRITATGNVGIGTANPAKKLHVQGDMRITNVPASAAPAQLLVVNNAGDVEGIAFTGSNTQFLRADGQWATPASSGVQTCATVAANYLQKWTSNNDLCNSQIFDNGTNIGVFTNAPNYPVHIAKSYGGSFGQGLLYVVDLSNNAGDDAAGYFKNDNVDFWGYGVYALGGYVGVHGAVNSSGSSTYYGVRGSGSAGTGTAFGVYGSASSSGTAYGVYGIASGTATNKYGVYGTTNGSSASQVGIYGQNTNSSGTAIVGVGNNLNTYFTLTGGSGAALNGERFGVFGKAYGTNATTLPMAAGYFDADNTVENPFAYVAQIPSAGTNIVSAGGYFDAGSGYGAYAYVGARHSGGTNYKIIGGGSMSTIVKAPDGTLRALHAIETPEIHFMDFGIARLVNGRARVELDPIFAHAIHVDDQRPLRVFVQVLNTFECGAVIVPERTQTFFTVEAERPCNAEFQWMVIANRASEYDENGNLIARYHDVRFELAPPPLERPELQRGQSPSVEDDPKIKQLPQQRMQRRVAPHGSGADNQ